MPVDRTRRSSKRTQNLGFASGIELFSAVAAPITIVTALLVHVGSTRSRAYYGYFGIDQGILSPSIQDYVLRSVDVTFGAVARLVVIALVFVILDRLLLSIIKKRSTQATLTWINVSLVAVGLMLLAGGLLFALGLVEFLGLSPLLAAAILGVGVVLTLRFGPAVFLRNDGKPSFGPHDSLALYIILVLALFWAATLYAQDLGQRAARNSDANPASLPLVTIFSDTYLDLAGSSVQADQVPGPDGTPRYRYSGLSLLTYANGRLFLVSGRYSDNYRSSVVVLRDSDSIRVEIAATATK